MGPVLTIAFGIALGFIILFLLLWLIGIIIYLLFGNSIMSSAGATINSFVNNVRPPLTR